MSSTDGVGSSTNTTALASTVASDNGLNQLSTDDFLKLIITQLQNQDPLNPTDNSQMLEQMNEIRNIGATDQMTTTLNSVLLGQNVTNATALIGKQISGLSDDNNKVTGVVDHVTITDGVPKVHVGDDTLSLNNISDILPATASSSS